MKKLVLVLAIALIAAPSFGAVTMTLTQVGTTNVYNVNYATSDANLPRAFALTVSVAGGGKISAVSGFKTGVSTAASQGYGIFPGTIDINSVTGNVNSYGTPVAPATDPGAAGTGIGTSTVVLEMGSLYVGDANKPATSGTLCTVTIDCNGATVNQTLSAALESTYRGGIVMENGAQPAVTIASATYTGCAPTDCLYVGRVFPRTICTPNLSADITVTTAMYNNWVTLGKPAVWCCNAQKCGNVANNIANQRVDVADVALVKGAWLKSIGQAGYSAAADTNISGRVDVADLAVVKGHWLVNVGLCLSAY
ncbi:MAG: hypothetical protein ACYC54_12300 [Sedimentisphaerales bacterium]